MVQPIQPDITRTKRTKRSTGIPTARSCHPAGNPIHGAKKATRYTIATTIEMRKMPNPYP